MAIIILCDRCGKESPNKKGLFVANKWFEVVVKEGNLGWAEPKKVFCRECFATINAVMGKMEEYEIDEPNPNIKGPELMTFTEGYMPVGCTCSKCLKGKYRRKRRWWIFSRLVCDHCGIALGEKREYISPEKAAEKMEADRYRGIPIEEWRAVEKEADSRRLHRKEGEYGN